MTRDEIRAAGGLLAEGIAQTAARVEEVHRAAAQRSFRASRGAGAPVELMHDSIATISYGATKLVSGIIGRAAAHAAAAARDPDAPSLSRTRGGNIAVAVLNGFLGDDLRTARNPLSLGMTVRRAGQDVELDRDSLDRAFPGATPRVAVFVHGLFENDESWRGAFGAQLHRDLGYTPVYLRYNTGLHISENGRELSGLLDALVAGWPLPVEELTLIGHSMGGLVARSAAHRAHLDGRRWVRALRHVVCLGAPHLGAPLEQGVNRAEAALARLPETSAFAKILEARSPGIKDLRYGYCSEDDWRDCDPRAYISRRSDVPFVDHAAYYFISATLGRDPDGLLSQLLGDLLVLHASASGHEHIPFEIDKGAHIGGITHFHLLHHPQVYDRLRAWLGQPVNASCAQIPA